MVISVAFQKGGSGKSTTAAALVNYARMQGKKVLGVDADAQMNFTYALGGSTAAPGLCDVLTGRTQAAQVIQHTQQADLISADVNITAAEQAIANRPGRDFILRKALEPLLTRYDLIVIDTPPALSTLLINALTASDRVLLPMQANGFAVMGLYQMRETIQQVQRYCNPSLIVSGILLTRFKPRQTLANDMKESIMEQAQEMGTTVFDTFIRETVAVEQAQAMQQSLFEFAPGSTAARDYKELFDEMNL